MDEACRRTNTTASVMLRGLRFHLLCGHDRKPLGCKNLQSYYSSAPVTCTSICVNFKDLPCAFRRRRSCTPWLQPVVILSHCGLSTVSKADSLPIHLWPHRHQQGVFPSNISWPYFPFLGSIMVDHAWRVLSHCRVIGWLIMCVNCAMNTVLAGTGRRVWKWSIP